MFWIVVHRFILSSTRLKKWYRHDGLSTLLTFLFVIRSIWDLLIWLTIEGTRGTTLGLLTLFLHLILDHLLTFLLDLLPALLDWISYLSYPTLLLDPIRAGPHFHSFTVITPLSKEDFLARSIPGEIFGYGPGFAQLILGCIRLFLMGIGLLMMGGIGNLRVRMQWVLMSHLYFWVIRIFFLGNYKLIQKIFFKI